jgi:hypothetical protein
MKLIYLFQGNSKKKLISLLVLIYKTSARVASRS